VSPPPTVASLRQRLRAALTAALKERDSNAVAALRSALGTIDNAEAVDPVHRSTSGGGAIAGAVTGLGAGEVARRDLSGVRAAAILGDEVASWESTAADYQRLGRDHEAALLRAQAAVVRTHLDGD